MPQVEITEVLVWYAVTPNGVEARVRKYAGDVAIQERSLPVIAETSLTDRAKADGRDTWTEKDICAEVSGALWAGDGAAGAALSIDIYPAKPAPVEAPAEAAAP